MRPIFTLFAGAAILFCSCSSSHKVQNSEDPGYSSGASRSASSGGNNDYYSTAPSDNYVRMKTTDDARWSQFDDYNSYDNYYASAPMAGSPYGFGYSPYSYGYGMYGYGYAAMSIGTGFWDPYFGWNSYFMWNMGYNPYFYNPYYGGCVMIGQQPGYYAGGSVASSGISPVYSHLTAFNASTYRATGRYSYRGSSNINRRSFINGRSPFSARSNYNSGSGRTFSDNSSRPSPPRTFTPRPSSVGSGSFGGGQPARSFPSGGGGGSFGGGGRSAFRH
jgi:hypothetical protein